MSDYITKLKLNGKDYRIKDDEGRIETENLRKDLEGKITGLNDDLIGHKNNEENPHKVTAEQTGAYDKPAVDERVNKLKKEIENYIPLTQKGVKNGVATLNDNGHVPSNQLPSYVDDVIDVVSEKVDNEIILKINGEEFDLETGVIYIDQNGKTYRYSGEQLVEIHSVEDLAEELIKTSTEVIAESISAVEGTIEEISVIDDGGIFIVENQIIEDSENKIPTSKAVKNYVDGKISNLDYNNLINKPDIPSIEGLAKKEYVDGQIANLQTQIENIQADTNKEEVKTIIAEYLEENSSETEDLNIESVITESDNIPTSGAVINYVQNELTNLPSGEEVDLSNYYTKSEVENLIMNSITTVLNEEV